MQKVRSVLKCWNWKFFQEVGHPENLAVVRIVIFYLVWKQTVFLEKTLTMASLPAEMRIAPTGYSLFFDVIPFSESAITFAHSGLSIFATCAIIGLWTRYTAPIAVMFALYFMGIMQMFGKIDHNHHIIWFSAVVSVSRCADALSVDALIAAWKRGGRGVTSPPKAHRVYGVPVRLLWVLFGVLYFFPGFWKLWAGKAWFDAQYASHKLHIMWYNNFDVLPAFRIDYHPWLLWTANVATVFAEMGMILAVFVYGIRTIWAFGMYVMHKGFGYFLKIKFKSAVLMLFAVFIDWKGIALWLGKILRCPWIHLKPKKSMTMRIIAIVRTVDVLGIIEVQDDLPEENTHRLRAVWMVGMTFIVLNIFCGFAIINSWPFAVYPRFHGVKKTAVIRQLEAVRIYPNGTEETLDLDAVMMEYLGHRWISKEIAMIGNKDLRERGFAGVITTLHKEGVVEAGDTVRINMTLKDYHPDLDEDQRVKDRWPIAEIPVRSL
ncbi:MAG: hypothetical protein HOG89_05205 [Candidatus Peribacter sp.]|jgi:hypothetical protein|nr:hypothetical protein [Candidatus Peribacter sp.]MBT4392621.1 hypothetical protein [Candidatus Peribacter sp.]MBT4601490.1 hypothetical protein [Candidatus Peribacter sp.]MBT5149509.1 hypothetical protein [Candidatus Peribacter sp.]MBT5638644.1 hypothetical protein [Candidatus Peribacter sp.]